MTAVAVGRFTPEQSEAIRMALSRAQAPLCSAADVASAKRILMESTPPRVVLVDAATAPLEVLVAWIRGRAELFGVLVVAVVPAPSGRAFAEAIAAGCDDAVVLGDLGAITRRAATLVHYDPTARPPATQGRAVLAHPAGPERRLLGRALRLAGFDVSFAETQAELTALAEHAPAVWVLSDGLPQRAVASLDHVRASQPDASCVLVTSEAERRRLARYITGKTAVVSEHAPADHLLFLINELLQPGLTDLRASRRVLYDGLCAFRLSGQLEPVFGLTYNISHDGLYVRTLDPPPSGETLWFELRPPHCGRAVHLRGTVMWVRRMDKRPGGIVPPGFGVQIDVDACPPLDLTVYRDAYSGLIANWRLVA